MNKLNIIYEDNHVIVADKPADILTQGDYSGETSLLEMIKEYVRVKFNKPGEAFIGLVHRLDRPVSGLLVFARTSKAAARLQKEFTSGRIKKFYLAIIENSGVLKQGWVRLENNLKRDRDITHIAAHPSPETEKGILFFYNIVSEGDYSLVLIKLDTGRKHQIRAQMAGMGKPVAGDKKYGSQNNTGEAIMLHSSYLSFHHPTREETMEFYSEPPELFSKFISYKKDWLAEKVKTLADNFDITQVCRD